MRVQFYMYFVIHSSFYHIMHHFGIGSWLTDPSMLFYKDVSVFNYSKADEIEGKESIGCLIELLGYENAATFVV